jgi:hypothetical protein
MKTKTFLIAAVMFLAFSVAAFAQGTLTVGSIPVTAVVASGLTEKTGDITFNPVGAQQYQSGVITINYGVPITVRGQVCAIGPGCVAVPGVAALPADPLAPNVFQVAITGPLAPVAFRVSGNRVAVAGSGLTSLFANLSATGNAIEVGQNNQVPVITSIQPGIGAFTVATPPGPAGYNSIFGGPTQVATLNIREGFFHAFGPATDEGYTFNRATMIKLTISPIPAGLRLSFPAAVAPYFSRTDANGVVQGADLPLPDLVGTNTVYYMVTAPTDPTLIDTLGIPVTVSILPGFPPLGVGSVTAIATFAPLGTASTLPPPQPVPRYVDAPAGPVTIAIVVPGTTTLLMPYAVDQVGYDTGIAISNTTKDPGAQAMGITETIVAQSGNITFYFYQDGDPVSVYTTQAGSPGAGLDATGNLVAGATYSVLLSEIAALAQPPIPAEDFQGYVFIICNFTNAHGQYFISDFEFFTNGALMLVIDTNVGTRKGERGLDQ